MSPAANVNEPMQMLLRVEESVEVVSFTGIEYRLWIVAHRGRVS